VRVARSKLILLAREPSEGMWFRVRGHEVGFHASDACAVIELRSVDGQLRHLPALSGQAVVDLEDVVAFRACKRVNNGLMTTVEVILNGSSHASNRTHHSSG